MTNEVPASAIPLSVTLNPADRRNISTDLWGIFFEDINYAADGGIMSELVQNGAFEYRREDSINWRSYTSWNKSIPDGSVAAFSLSTTDPLAQENPHYAVIEVEHGSASLTNLGFDGMAFRRGKDYAFSIWTRNASPGAMPMSLNVELLGDGGIVIAATSLSIANRQWTQLHATLTAGADASQGRLRLVFAGEGTAHIDFVSLEPTETFRGLQHFRPDLVKALADLKPAFVRFPGGCIVHGKGYENMYHWNRTVGPVEHRPHQFNSWGYHQSFRLGYYEYFRLCETIGAKPLPIVAAAVSCQFSDQGPVPVPQSEMQDYIDEVLDLIEFANGPTDSHWGRIRAEMGHPEPFGLTMLGLGNEDAINDVFERRFRQLYQAVTAAHPEITIVGTVGPAPSGHDFDEGWRFMRELHVPIVDEHAYQSPSWWFQNLDHYDHVDRKGPKVYFGEYSANVWNAHPLVGALGEAAFMANMERNGDAVAMSSYAPLFCNINHAQWKPDLIYFDNKTVRLPYSYWVQHMFSTTTCDEAYPVNVAGNTTVRRDLSDRIRLNFRTNRADVDITDITFCNDETGDTIPLCDVHLRGSDVATALDTVAERYTLRMHASWKHVAWGFSLQFGDFGDFKDSNEINFGRGGSRLRVIRDGSGYSLGEYQGPVTAQLDDGNEWDIEVRVADRGRSLSLFVNGQLLASGQENPDEPRRIITVARDSAARNTYVRVINGSSAPLDIDVSDVLGALHIDGQSARNAAIDVLAGDDPYAGAMFENSPTMPSTHALDLSDGLFEVPAWSLCVVTLPEQTTSRE
ncbi:alpha-L-arabinofuranosidase C-terminal domain-containing protein [Bifidobacterium oedipodis]|uniref:non-reducing end alpha-L-arabinofuranosidase n=1 Tax=Bifidobacterium oedipodis TaxID=2675322 RepID=A0A7Y0HTB4_9BIFI|nr:alpha-L-arabinofuranosidase C-terminal domain-containing protein [Bifidobacterium sp. DSM 109957]NMM94428.1 alpha-L-arabinofuranosidase [Bifidobacterium sp. DSM 109957]